MQNNRVKNSLSFILAVFAIFLYFYHSQLLISVVQEAMILCCNSVIPSLYIFMVVCSLLAQTGCCEVLSIPFMPYFRLLGINSKRAAGYCILGILGGFATGAVMLDKISKEFNCDANIIKLISFLLSGNSPAFVIVAVGIYYLKSMSLGLMLYFSVLISSLIIAFFASFTFAGKLCDTSKINTYSVIDITGAIKASVKAVLNICGVVIFVFSLCKAVSLYCDNSFILMGISSIFEVTTACQNIYDIFDKNIYFFCAALTVFPVSAYLQMKSVGDNGTLSLRHIFIAKFFQIPLSLLILRTLLNLFPQAASVYSNGDISVITHWNKPYISFYMFVLSVYFVAVADKKIGVFTARVK